MGEPIDPNQGAYPYPPAPYHQAPYHQAPYHQAPYHQAPPAYPGQPYPPPPGYPSYYVQPDDRPGVAMSAAVLAFVCSGLLIAAGLLLLIGASLISAISADVSREDHHAALWLGVAGTADLVAAGLAIGGAIALLLRRDSGRIILTVAAALDVMCAIGWLTQGTGSLIFVALLAGPLIVTVPLMWRRAVSTWLRAG